MANEITIQTAMSRQHATVTADNHQVKYSKRTYDQSGAGQDDRKHTIGTTEEQITFTDISTNGWVYLENQDQTNYVQWGFSTGVYGGRMKLGQTAGPFFMEPGASLFLKANTAACRVRIVHYEA